MASRDATALEHHAHSLKGSVSTFGANRAFEAAFALEKQGRSGDLTGAEEGLLQLEQALEALRPELVSLPDQVAAQRERISPRSGNAQRVCYSGGLLSYGIHHRNGNRLCAQPRFRRRLHVLWPGDQEGPLAAGFLPARSRRHRNA